MPETRRMAMFPLSTVLFPGALLPLQVFEPRYRTMMAECLASEPPEFGVVLITRGSEVGGGDERSDVGTVARVDAVRQSADGRYALLARGTTRLRVTQWLPDDPYPQALVEEIDDTGDTPAAPEDTAHGRGDAATALRRVEALLSELGSSVPDQPVTAGDPLWELCSRLPVNALDRQRLLETDEPGARARLLTELATALADDLTRLLAEG